ncbi:MAG: hypothetical protein OHK0044_16310 [Burkholderiaceae bacterium]
MKLRARTRLHTMLVASCALLLAQWSLATHACSGYAVPDGAIEVTAPATPAPGAHSDCEGHEEVASTICVKHCGDEARATPHPAFAAAAPAATGWWASAVPELAAPQQALRCDLAQPHAPPLTILYCVSLT